MASNATLTVNIPAPDGSIIKVDVKAPSETTLSLRKKVDKFIRASYVIWKALPSSQTKLVATPEVLDEVIQNATAFHATEQGIVNMVWIKKDMPMEALRYREVGYWLDGAGPGPRAEQAELQVMRAIPEPIMDYIRRSQDHNLISHYLYAFIDFWVLILLHLLTWLACLFWYGYLCIICPILIIGESSKLLNLLLRLPPRLLFREDLLEQDFFTFLNGVFTLDFLKSLCITTSFKEWEELEMDSDDFLQAIGVPIVIQYGPLAHHYGIYIPKYHPYGANHILSVGVDMDRLDRQIRRLAELATRIVNAAPAFPLDGNRKDKLIKLRHFIMVEAQKLGVLTELDALKNNMRQTNLAFRGTQQVAAIRNTGVNTGSGQNPNALRGLTAVRAEDEKLSDKRKAWAVIQINELREKMEDGHNIRLLACPSILEHGSTGHARWLYRAVAQNADLVNAACATSLNNPLTAEQLKALDEGHDRCGLERKDDTNTISTSRALQALSQQPKDRPSRLDIFRIDCPYCKRIWLIKQTSFPAHKCLVLLKETILPLRETLLRNRSEIEKEATQSTLDDVPSFSTGVSRRPISSPLAWTIGDRLTGEEAFWEHPDSNTKEKHRDPKPNEPVYIRAIDLRGRLYLSCLQRSKLQYPYQLLAIPGYAAELFDPATKALKDPEGYSVGTVGSYVRRYPAFEKRLKAPEKANLKKFDAVPVLLYGKDNNAWKEEQIRNILRGNDPRPVHPEFPLLDIQDAVRERVTRDLLRPEENA